MKIKHKTISLVRVIHVYVSMALLTLLLFFAITGITLNHPEWFDDNSALLVEREYELDSALLTNPPLSPVQLVAVVAAIEGVLNVSLDNASIESSVDELFIALKSAGKNSAITVDLETAELFYQHSDYGWWALLNDLHKGRNTSMFWSIIIDLTSVLFIVFAVSGFILAMPQRRFRRTLSLAGGVSVSLLVGVIFLG